MKLLFCLALPLSFASAISQGQVQDSDRDQGYTPPQGSVFDESKGGNSESGQIRNALMLEPTALGRGVLAANYRHRFGEFPISICGTFGIILEKDYIYVLQGEELLDLFPYESELPIATLYKYSAFTNGNRLFTQIGLKYNFTGDDVGGTGMEFGIRFHNLRLETPEEIEDYFLIRPSKIDVNMRIYYIGFSHVFVSRRGARPFVQALSYGLGYRTITYDGFERSETESYDEYRPVFKLSGEKESEWSATFMLSYSLGFGW